MIRQDVKSAIKNTLTGVPGVKSVFIARQKFTGQAQTPVITVYLPEVRESLLSMSGNPAIKRKIELTALLEIIVIDANNQPEIGEAAFDNLLDAVDNALRKDFTLGGVVLGAAIKHLETDVAAPQLVEGQNVFRIALKKFDVTITTTGIDGNGNYLYA